MRKSVRYSIFILILALLTVSTVFALLKMDPLHQKYSARGIHADVPKFNASDVAKIKLEWRNIHTNLYLKDGRWVIKERSDAPASVPRISNLIQTFSELSPVKELTACSPEILKDLHLVDTDPKVIPGVRAILYDNSGKELFNILLGKGHFVRPDPNMPSANNAEGRYVRIGNKVYLVPLVFENCHPMPAAWIEPLRMYELQKAISISSMKIQNAETALIWSAFRKSTRHPFTLIYPRGKQTENRMLSGLAARLTKPFATDFYTGKFDENKRKSRFIIRCVDGFAYTLEIFEGTKDQDAASLKINFDPAQLIAFPGETQPQLEQRKKVLMQRFTFEKNYSEGLLFAVSKDLAGILEIIPEKTAK